MFNISPMEFIVIGIIALIVLGPARLPEVARNVGRGMREFRAAVTGASVSLGGGDDDDEDEDLDDEIPDPDDPSVPGSADPDTPASSELPEGR